MELIGAWEDAASILSKILEIFQNSASPEHIVITKNTLAKILFRKGRFNEALRMYQDIYQHYSQVNSVPNMSLSAVNIGMSLWMMGKSDEAMEYLEKGMALARESGEGRIISQALGNIGNAYALQGLYQKARECYQEQMALSEQMGDMNIHLYSLTNLGNIYLLLQEFDKAVDLYERAAILSLKIGNKLAQLTVRGNLGLIAQNRGDLAKAEGSYLEQLSLAQQIGYIPGVITAYGKLGSLYQSQGRLTISEEYYKRQCILSQKIGDVLNQWRAYSNLALNCLLQDSPERAVKYCQQADGVMIKYIDPIDRGHLYWHWAEALFELGEFMEAKAKADETWNIFKELNDQTELKKLELFVRIIEFRLGKKDNIEDILSLIDGDGRQELYAEAYYRLYKETLDSRYKTMAEKYVGDMINLSNDFIWKKRWQEIGE